ncbi:MULTISPECIES: CDI toxin immunity protein [Citrobacter]|uniref:Uncharacterized protein n=1 Tax=Citrobacter pasteurii TaxID=1563222 RepID=A0A6N6K538_9ENTR|nr:MULTISPECIES: hypothetical protein [Citrobacter]TKU08426.1 hypothetical protein FDW86_11120 [Citrobacter sp. wls828]EIS7447139.1 hypothetical protein [Citrobacter youngae]KAA1279381.1 hypothetical protein DXF85_05465 [Citrobacter pasteurii]MBJ9157109.1 hypothetical protein [Citrobacter sp. FDAARGOS_156]MBK6258859.1 hypothetical protein [Citrobacter youngae]
MTLFDECKEALSADFNVLDEKDQVRVMGIFNKYPSANGNILWSEIDFKDFETVNDFLNEAVLKNEDVYVIADNADIPIFKTNLRLVFENIYDVTALSPKLFIFNENVILQPLFPTDKIRLGVRLK